MAGRTDDIASLRKWQDRIRREMTISAKQTPGEFHINPKTLSSLAPAIGAADKTHPTLETTMKRDKDVKEVVALLETTKLTPLEKSARPRTVAEEIGWYAAEAEKPPFKAVHALSEEVKYAQVYYETFHCGPFGKTQPVAR